MITRTKILAALAELRTTAEAATPGPWEPDGSDAIIAGYRTPTRQYVVSSGDISAINSREDAEHIAAWSPAAVLRWLSWAEQVAARHAHRSTTRPHPRPGGAMIPRWLHRLYASLAGYFWLPCPLCGRHFGGHEWRDRDGLPAQVPAGKHEGRGICPTCTRAGRGVALR